MNSKDAVKRINEIEKSIDITSYQLDNLNFWPFIRLCLWTNFTSGDSQPKTRLQKKQHLLLSSLVSFFASLRSLIKVNFKLKACDVVFVSKENDWTNISEGRAYDKNLDPIFEILEKRLNCQKIELYHGQKASKKSYYELLSLPTVFMLPFLTVFRVIKSRQMNKLSKNIKKLGKYHLSLSIDRAVDIFYYQAYFKLVLRLLKPKAVFLSCYYCPLHFGLVAACKELNIKTFEVQHGKQGKYHAMYNHWQAVPKKGYKILPDFFLNWGNESVDNITKSSSENFTVNHTPFAVGNLWSSKWINDDMSHFLDEQDYQFLHLIGQFKKRILITLQPIKNPLPEFVVESFKNLTKSTIVMIRLHPAMRGKDQKIVQLIPKHVKCTIDINRSSSVKLYALLKLINLHLTASSTVCFEAQLFQIPTILFHSSGKTLYQKEIDRKIFWYADSQIKLENLVCQFLKKKPKLPTLDYIITDRKRITTSLKLLLKKVGLTYC